MKFGRGACKVKFTAELILDKNLYGNAASVYNGIIPDLGGSNDIAVRSERYRQT